MEKFEPLIDKEELSKFMKYKPSTVDFLRRNKKIPAYGNGRNYRYKLSEVIEALKRN